MAFAIGTFLFSLASIVSLFALKAWEIRRGTIVVPALRERLNVLAARTHELLLALEADFEKLPPEMLHLARAWLHYVVLFSAALLRFLALQAHRLADFVSHKHSFRRRAPRSEFLKKVLEHKNGNSASPEALDTTF